MTTYGLGDEGEVTTRNSFHNRSIATRVPMAPELGSKFTYKQRTKGLKLRRDWLKFHSREGGHFGKNALFVQKLNDLCKESVKFKTLVWHSSISELNDILSEQAERSKTDFPDDFLKNSLGRVSAISDHVKRQNANTASASASASAPAPAPLPPAPAPLQCVEKGSETPVPEAEAFEMFVSGAKLIIEESLRYEKGTQPELKSAKLKYKMEINKKVCQISNRREQVNSVVNELTLIFNEALCLKGRGFLSYCLCTCANKIILQAETQIALHMPSTFPVAQVVIDISSQHKDFLPILLYLMASKYPYLSPSVTKEASVSDLEDRPMTEEKISGIIYLFAALIQTSPSNGTFNKTCSKT